MEEAGEEQTAEVTIERVDNFQDEVPHVNVYVQLDPDVTSQLEMKRFYRLAEEAQTIFAKALKKGFLDKKVCISIIKGEE